MSVVSLALALAAVPLVAAPLAYLLARALLLVGPGGDGTSSPTRGSLLAITCLVGKPPGRHGSRRPGPNT